MEMIRKNAISIFMALLPFSAFLTIIIDYGFGFKSVFPLGVSMWKDVFLMILLCVLAYRFFKNELKFNSLDKIIFLYFVVGILASLYNFEALSLKQILYGARYDFLPCIAYFAARYFYKVDNKTILKTAVYAGGISLFLGLLLHFILTPEFLVNLGFRNDWSTWYAGQSLAFCQKIEHSEICRLSGLFSGPNQLGAYCIVYFGLALSYLKSVAKKKERNVVYFCLLLSFISLLFTFSRSAYIGLLIFATMFIFHRFKLSARQIFTAASFGILILGIITIAFPEILLRMSSSSQHLVAMQEGITVLSKNAFGLGLGTAGPASYHFGNPIIPENWYLQVAIESGILGLCIFVVFLLLLFKISYSKVPEISYSLLGLCVMALFLHTFEDSSTVITLFLILGLYSKE